MAPTARADTWLLNCSKTIHWGSAVLTKQQVKVPKAAWHMTSNMLCMAAPVPTVEKISDTPLLRVLQHMLRQVRGLVQLHFERYGTVLLLQFEGASHIHQQTSTCCWALASQPAHPTHGLSRRNLPKWPHPAPF